jgi:NAD(P)-dependent dehydrogenase (short-subunit alcohol dehydrogenase family)
MNDAVLFHLSKLLNQDLLTHERAQSPDLREALRAVEVLTRYMAQELGPRRISVNVIAPGGIETDFGGGALRDNAELNKLVASQTALGRVGLPDDIGGAVAMLLAPESHWITGQRIEATGGYML